MRFSTDFTQTISSFFEAYTSPSKKNLPIAQILKKQLGLFNSHPEPSHAFALFEYVFALPEKYQAHFAIRSFINSSIFKIYTLMRNHFILTEALFAGIFSQENSAELYEIFNQIHAQGLLTHTDIQEVLKIISEVNALDRQNDLFIFAMQHQLLDSTHLLADVQFFIHHPCPATFEDILQYLKLQKMLNKDNLLKLKAFRQADILPSIFKHLKFDLNPAEADECLDLILKNPHFDLIAQHIARVRFDPQGFDHFKHLFHPENIELSIEKLHLFLSTNHFNTLGYVEASLLHQWDIEQTPLEIIETLSAGPLANSIPDLLPMICANSSKVDFYTSYQQLHQHHFLNDVRECANFLDLTMNHAFVFHLDELIKLHIDSDAVSDDQSFASFKKHITYQETLLAFQQLLGSLTEVEIELLDEVLAEDYAFFMDDNVSLDSYLELIASICQTNDEDLPINWVLFKNTHAIRTIAILLESPHFTTQMLSLFLEKPSCDDFRNTLMIYKDHHHFEKHTDYDYFEVFDTNVLNAELFPMIFESTLEHPNPIAFGVFVTKLIANDWIDAPLLNASFMHANIHQLNILFDKLLEVYIDDAENPKEALLKLIQFSEHEALLYILEHRFIDAIENQFWRQLLAVESISSFSQLFPFLNPEIFKNTDFLCQVLNYPHPELLHHILSHLTTKIAPSIDFIQFIIEHPLPELVEGIAKHKAFENDHELIKLLNQATLIHACEQSEINITGGIFNEEGPTLALIDALMAFESAHPEPSFDTIGCWPSLRMMRQRHQLLNLSQIDAILQSPKSKIFAEAIQQCFALVAHINLPPADIFDRVLAHPNPQKLLETLETLATSDLLNTEQLNTLCANTNPQVFELVISLGRKQLLDGARFLDTLGRFSRYSLSSQVHLLSIFNLLPPIDIQETKTHFSQMIFNLNDMDIEHFCLLLQTPIFIAIASEKAGLDIMIEALKEGQTRPCYHLLHSLSISKIYAHDRPHRIYQALHKILSHPAAGNILKFLPQVLNLTPNDLTKSTQNLNLLFQGSIEHLHEFFQHFPSINQRVFEKIMEPTFRLPFFIKLIQQLINANLLDASDEKSQLDIFTLFAALNLDSFLSFHAKYPLIDANPTAFKRILEHRDTRSIGYFISFLHTSSNIDFSQLPMKHIFQACLNSPSPSDAGYLWWNLYDVGIFEEIGMARFEKLCNKHPKPYELGCSINNKRERYLKLNKQDRLKFFQLFANSNHPDEFSMLKHTLDAIKYPNASTHLQILFGVAKHPQFMLIKKHIEALLANGCLDADVVKKLVAQQDLEAYQNFIYLLSRNQLLNKNNLMFISSHQNLKQAFILFNYLNQGLQKPFIEKLQLIWKTSNLALINCFCKFLEETKLLKEVHINALLKHHHIIFHHPDVKEKLSRSESLVLTSINIIQILKIATKNQTNPAQGGILILRLLEGLEHNSRHQQSTHLVSIHESANQSASRLYNRYQDALIDPLFLSNQFGFLKQQIEHLSLGNLRLAALRCLERLQSLPFQQAELTPVAVTQLLGLCIYAAQDTSQISATVDDAFLSIIHRMLEIQRGGNDANLTGRDLAICISGSFNKLIESLVGIHPDCCQQYLCLEAASLKLPRLVVHTTKDYFLAKAIPDSRENLLELVQELDLIATNGIESLWPKIKDDVSRQFFEEYHPLFQQQDHPKFIEILDCVIDIDASEFIPIVGQLKAHFQEQFARIQHLFFSRNPGSAAEHDAQYSLAPKTS